jgi:hypothetical protein
MVAYWGKSPFPGVAGMILEVRSGVMRVLRCGRRDRSWDLENADSSGLTHWAAV